MRKLVTFLTEVGVLYCPRCMRGYEVISQTDGKWLCYDCGYDFGSLPESMWRTETVKAVLCGEYGIEVTLIKDNYLIGFETPIVACPKCLRVLAVHYRRSGTTQTSLWSVRAETEFSPLKNRGIARLPSS